MSIKAKDEYCAFCGGEHPRFLDGCPHLKKEPLTKEKYWKQIEGSEGGLTVPDTEEKVMWWEEYWEAHPKENAKLEQDILESRAKQGDEFMFFKIFLKSYLEINSKDGPGDFRLVWRKNGECMIHPLGRDGQTYDFKI